MVREPRRLDRRALFGWLPPRAAEGRHRVRAHRTATVEPAAGIRVVEVPS